MYNVPSTVLGASFPQHHQLTKQYICSTSCLLTKPQFSLAQKYPLLKNTLLLKPLRVRGKRVTVLPVRFKCNSRQQGFWEGYNFTDGKGQIQLACTVLLLPFFPSLCLEHRCNVWGQSSLLETMRVSLILRMVKPEGALAFNDFLVLIFCNYFIA